MLHELMYTDVLSYHYRRAADIGISWRLAEGKLNVQFKITLNYGANVIM
jgi:hypothetical protein